MMTRAVRLAFAGPTTALLVGVACSDGPLGPASFAAQDFEIVAGVRPARLGPGDSALVYARVRNHADTAITFSFGMGCPFFLSVADIAERRVDMHGVWYACIALGTSRSVPARDSAEWSHPIAARIRGAPAPYGRYVVRLDFTTHTIPDLVTGFVVE